MMQEIPADCQKASYEPVEIQGRRFLRNTSYVLPKDGGEVNRLDFQHYLLRQAFRGDYLAPIGHHPGSILDVGSGTGIWGKTLAQQFPETPIYSVDLEHIKTTGLTPPNYTFVQGNILEGLPFGDESFRFVHQRLLVSAIRAPYWPTVIRELLRVTQPGGYIELVECAFEGINLGPFTQHFFTWGKQAFQSRGIDLQIIPELGRYLREAGVRDIQERLVDLPLGSWGGRIGSLTLENQSMVFQSMRAVYTQMGGEQEFDTLLAQLPQEWEHHHSLFRFYAFWGRK
ncbi:MAG: methyltransferase domain-containing protein [Ktedonobacteraceae bacterium]